MTQINIRVRYLKRRRSGFKSTTCARLVTKSDMCAYKVRFKPICWACVSIICLAEMHIKNGRCNGLIEETAAALDEDVVVLMLLAVQRGNLELSVKTALSQ